MRNIKILRCEHMLSRRSSYQVQHADTTSMEAFLTNFQNGIWMEFVRRHVRMLNGGVTCHLWVEVSRGLT